ncbi:hypothetical protein AB0G32_17130 [Streptomyces sp. NPDC023723]|uniref:hypothetical protein n=1 Tax=Streptomyces sp. NPDC023723 TaxID=3154323 RepID=UPI0033EB55F0
MLDRVVLVRSRVGRGAVHARSKPYVSDALDVPCVPYVPDALDVPCVPSLPDALDVPDGRSAHPGTYYALRHRTPVHQVCGRPRIFTELPRDVAPCGSGP